MSCDFGKQCNKLHSALVRKPGTCYQTYFSFPSSAPLPNAHAHEEKYGWLARLGEGLEPRLRTNFFLAKPEKTKPGRGKPVLIMQLAFLSCHISRTQSFQQNWYIIFRALVVASVPGLPRSVRVLISRLVACSAQERIKLYE